MPAYKDSTTGKWYTKFYYEDHKGIRKQKLKRGFELKREAQEWERDFLENLEVQLDIPFNKFVEIYNDHIKPKIRLTTWETKENIQNDLIEFFGDTPINEIDKKVVSRYINSLIENEVANTTIKSRKEQLSAIFNHAIDYYGLKTNPTHKLGSITNPNESLKEYTIWTVNDFNNAISVVNDIDVRTLFNLLFWSGLRIGEAEALTWNDVNFDTKMLTINKSFKKLKGKEIITPTKTYDTRKIMLPDTTINQLKEYKNAIYKPSDSDRLFQKYRMTYWKRLKNLCEQFDLPRISLHDLRHSHASFLLNAGVNIVAISKRLGHKDVSTTLNTYSHFMPNDEINFITKINNLK